MPGYRFAHHDCTMRGRRDPGRVRRCGSASPGRSGRRGRRCRASATMASRSPGRARASPRPGGRRIPGRLRRRPSSPGGRHRRVRARTSQQASSGSVGASRAVARRSRRARATDHPTRRPAPVPPPDHRARGPGPLRRCGRRPRRRVRRELRRASRSSATYTASPVVVLPADRRRRPVVSGQVGCQDAAGPAGERGSPLAATRRTEVVEDQEVGHGRAPISSRNRMMRSSTKSGCSTCT